MAILVCLALSTLPALAQAPSAAATGLSAAPTPSAPPPAALPAPPAIAAPAPSTFAPGIRQEVPPAAPREGGRRISLLSMVRASDPVVQGVMLFLVLCSAATWAVMIEKSVILARVARQTRRFSVSLRDVVTMDEVGGANRQESAGPARAMWAAARREWDLSIARIPQPFGADQTSRLLQRLNLAMGSAQEQALSQLGNWMGVLATVGATAPFIGLFGTVWGILHSFAQIAATQSTSLAVVAPGIAEALLTTAVGLFAAIPATMFYNRFARAIGQITGALDNVSAELLTLASRDSERLAR